MNKKIFSHDNFKDFESLFSKDSNQIIYETLVSDTLTPVGAMIKLGEKEDYSFLLESVEGGKTRGRFSVIGIEPDLIWRCKNKIAEINNNPLKKPKSFLKETFPPIISLRNLLKENFMETNPLPPMAAGLFGYFGYDMIKHFEKIPESKIDSLNLYDSLLIRPSLIAIFDRLKDTITITVQIRKKEWNCPLNAWKHAKEKISKVKNKLGRELKHDPISINQLPFPKPKSNISKSYFFKIVKKAKEYISAGDIFQIVLSIRFSIPFLNNSFSLYRSLRRLNPSPFLFHFSLGDFSIIGSSPEILVRLRNGEVTIRPVAGTRPRGKDETEDKINASNLLSDIKERSEHLMLLDLGRNDVGRVSKPKTVKVISNFEVEYYSHVMHIASEVNGKLKEKLDAIDALIAGFPAGTVSGAPKIRAMEIISKLEEEKRGVYAGAIGYIGSSGEMDTCIALRTAIIKNSKMYVQSGAGIVYDSIPEKEYEECENKAKALFQAASDTIQYNK